MARPRVYRFGDSTLTLEFADIMTSQAQVLVTPDDSFLQMAGGLSAAICKAGGNAIALDAAKQIPVAVGDIAVTTARALQAYYVFHAVTIDLGGGFKQSGSLQILEMTIRRCMQLVDVLSVRSIAFPPMGASIATGLSYAEVAARMADVIADELRDVERPVEVALYIYDDSNRPVDLDPFDFAEEFARCESQWQVVPDLDTPDKARDNGKDVFISYSHRDEKWLDRLTTMLKPLVRKGSISIWSDKRIEPGVDWKKEIEETLVSAKVAVLLVSRSFLASDFIAKQELPPLLKAVKEKELKLLWVYLSPCLYEETEIGNYQAAHDICRPLTRMRGANLEDQLVKVCQAIKQAVLST